MKEIIRWCICGLRNLWDGVPVFHRTRPETSIARIEIAQAGRDIVKVRAQVGDAGRQVLVRAALYGGRRNMRRFFFAGYIGTLLPAAGFLEDVVNTRPRPRIGQMYQVVGSVVEEAWIAMVIQLLFMVDTIAYTPMRSLPRRSHLAIVGWIGSLFVLDGQTGSAFCLGSGG